MTHPAVADEELHLLSSYNIDRLDEFRVLTEPEVLNWMAKNEFEIVGYNSL
jgi:YdjC-like protein.